MRNMKRIVALAGVVVLVGVYLTTLITAIFAKSLSSGMFMASLYCTIAVPIIIYGFMTVYKMVHKNDDNGISIRKLKKMNKEYEKAEKNRSNQK